VIRRGLRDLGASQDLDIPLAAAGLDSRALLSLWHATIAPVCGGVVPSAFWRLLADEESTGRGVAAALQKTIELTQPAGEQGAGQVEERPPELQPRLRVETLARPFDPLDTQSFGAVRGPVAPSGCVFYIPGLPGVCQLEFVQLCQHLADVTVVGLPYAAAMARPALTMESLAFYLVSEMRAVQPEGPYKVAGFSLGGCIAMAVCRALEEIGHSVHSLVLLDPIFPSSSWVPRPCLKLALRSLQQPAAPSHGEGALAWDVVLRLASAAAASPPLDTPTLLVHAVGPLTLPGGPRTSAGLAAGFDRGDAVFASAKRLRRVRVSGSHASFLTDPAEARRALAAVRVFLQQGASQWSEEDEALAWAVEFLSGQRPGGDSEAIADTPLAQLGLSSFALRALVGGAVQRLSSGSGGGAASYGSAALTAGLEDFSGSVRDFVARLAAAAGSAPSAAEWSHEMPPPLTPTSAFEPVDPSEARRHYSLRPSARSRRCYGQGTVLVLAAEGGSELLFESVWPSAVTLRHGPRYEARQRGERSLLFVCRPGSLEDYRRCFADPRWGQVAAISLVLNCWQPPSDSAALGILRASVLSRRIHLAAPARYLRLAPEGTQPSASRIADLDAAIMRPLAEVVQLTGPDRTPVSSAALGAAALRVARASRPPPLVQLRASAGPGGSLVASATSSRLAGVEQEAHAASSWSLVHFRGDEAPRASSSASAGVSHLSIYYEVQGPLNPLLLQAALDDVVLRSPALRTTLPDRGLRGVAHSHLVVPLQVVRCIGSSEKLARALSPDNLHRRLNFERGPLLRVLACVKAPDHWLLALVAHHAILDLYSTHQVTQQLLAAYTHSLRAACPALPRPVFTLEREVEATGVARPIAVDLSRLLAAAPQLPPIDRSGGRRDACCRPWTLGGAREWAAAMERGRALGGNAFQVAAALLAAACVSGEPRPISLCWTQREIMDRRMCNGSSLRVFSFSAEEARGGFVPLLRAVQRQMRSPAPALQLLTSRPAPTEAVVVISQLLQPAEPSLRGVARQSALSARPALSLDELPLPLLMPKGIDIYFMLDDGQGHDHRPPSGSVLHHKGVAVGLVERLVAGLARGVGGA